MVTGYAADHRFRLWDLRQLTADDIPGVIEESGRLRDTGYHTRPVSLGCSRGSRSAWWGPC